MAKKNKTLQKPVIIIVEGLDYLHLLLSQIAEVAEFADVQLWDFAEGVSFGDSLQLLKDERNFEDMVRALGIIRDVEYSRAETDGATRAALNGKGLAAPGAQMTVAVGAPKTGYLLIPDAEQAGCLEHACLKASKLSTEQLACADGFYDCVSRHHAHPLNANHQAKLKVHATIAGCGKNPAMSLGQSGKAGIWDFEQPSLKVMLTFIRMMRNA